MSYKEVEYVKKKKSQMEKEGEMDTFICKMLYYLKLECDVRDPCCKALSNDLRYG